MPVLPRWCTETVAQFAAAHSTQNAANISACGTRVFMADRAVRGPQRTSATAPRASADE